MAFIIGLGLMTGRLSAQAVWDNGNGTNAWNTANNWNPNSTPTAASNVQFNATDDNATVSDISLGGNRSANSLTYNNVDDNFSIVNGSGSRTLTLTSGDITRSAGSSGTQTIAASSLALGGDAAMSIDGSGSLTISSVIKDSGGARSLTKSGAGELILSAANTFSGGTIVSAGTLTLQNATAFGTGTTLTLSGGTLKLSGISASVNTLNVTGNSIIDFSGNSTLSVVNLSISGTFTLTIQNWANASDFFFAQNWTGATYNTSGSNPMSLVTFNGAANTDTKWLSYEDNAGSGYHQITPVPEPSTYGALLLVAAGGLLAWRRRVSRRDA